MEASEVKFFTGATLISFVIFIYFIIIGRNCHNDDACLIEYCVAGFLAALMFTCLVLFGTPSWYCVGFYNRMAEALEKEGADEKNIATKFCESFTAVVIIKYLFALLIIFGIWKAHFEI